MVTENSEFNRLFGGSLSHNVVSGLFLFLSFSFQKIHFNLYFLNVYLCIYSLLPYRSFIVFMGFLNVWMCESLGLYLFLVPSPRLFSFCWLFFFSCFYVWVFVLSYHVLIFINLSKKRQKGRWSVWEGKWRGTERSCEDKFCNQLILHDENAFWIKRKKAV